MFNLELWLRIYDSVNLYLFFWCKFYRVLSLKEVKMGNQKYQPHLPYVGYLVVEGVSICWLLLATFGPIRVEKRRERGKWGEKGWKQPPISTRNTHLQQSIFLTTPIAKKPTCRCTNCKISWIDHCTHIEIGGISDELQNLIFSQINPYPAVFFSHCPYHHLN